MDAIDLEDEEDDKADKIAIQEKIAISLEAEAAMVIPHLL